LARITRLAAAAAVFAVDQQVAAVLRAARQSVTTAYARALFGDAARGGALPIATQEAARALAITDAMLAIVIIAADPAGTAGLIVLAALRALVCGSAVLAAWAMVVVR